MPSLLLVLLDLKTFFRKEKMVGKKKKEKRKIGRAYHHP
jgi:hypothetical protein